MLFFYLVTYVVVTYDSYVMKKYENTILQFVQFLLGNL